MSGVADKMGIAEEAARLVCEEQLSDYRTAKLKALQRLRLPPRTPLPDNAHVHAAVLDYLQLFGGDAYRQRLQKMRRTAPRVMQRLVVFDPRLSGSVVSGAVTKTSHLQLHLFADQAELLDVFLLERGIDFDQDERRYRYPDGHEEALPLARFAFEDLVVDAVVFPAGEQSRVPLSPLDGLPCARLTLAEALRLAAESGDQGMGNRP